jgi:hypothetical protein
MPPYRINLDNKTCDGYPNGYHWHYRPLQYVDMPLSPRSSKSEVGSQNRYTINFHLSTPDKQLLIFYDNANLIDMLTRGQLFTTFAGIFQDPAGGRLISGLLRRLGEVRFDR